MVQPPSSAEFCQTTVHFRQTTMWLPSFVPFLSTIA
jgi:hypothetical protein